MAFKDRQNFLAAYVGSLVAIDAKPHHRKHWLVGVSCLLLAVPSLLALVNSDHMTAVWLIVVATCSLLADCLLIGTVWNVIDRWVAVAFTVYLFSRAFQVVPVLTTLNMLVVACVLAWSRSSCTPEQWRWRHSCWHLTMMFDIAFFLTCIYLH